MENDKIEMLLQQHKTEDKVKSLFKIFTIKTLLHRAGIKKEAGVPVAAIFHKLFLLAFHGCGINGMFNDKTPEGFHDTTGKDVYYRFMNNPRNNWRKLLSAVVVGIIKKLKKWNHDNSTKYLIIDDTSRHKRGRKVEFSGYFFDHVLKKTVWGMVDVFLGWSDGKTFLPLDFSIRAGKKYKEEAIKHDVDKRTSGGKRRKEALEKKTTMMIAMLERAYQAGIDASYVMFDSWFSFPATIRNVYNIGYDVICRLKKMETIRFIYKEQLLSIKKLYKIAKKMGKREKFKQYFVFTIDAFIQGKGECGEFPVRIVFSRDYNSKGYETWLTTDMNLDATEVLSHYGKRWAIETFFKVMKQNFRLGKEHSNTFEAIIGFTTLCCLRFAMLSFYQRDVSDIYTLDSIFYKFRNNSLELATISKVVAVLRMCFGSLSSLLFQDSALKDNIMQLIDTLMSFLFKPVDFSPYRGCET